LVGALEDDFDPSAWHDEYRERVEQLIEAKRKGTEIELEHFEEPSQEESLAEMLQASLQGSR
ncbi:MAG: Ku protein, partial [Planctomycetes bacterium]|nr:Ku protein [Planctomycetota bacterium]